MAIFKNRRELDLVREKRELLKREIYQGLLAEDGELYKKLTDIVIDFFHHLPINHIETAQECSLGYPRDRTAIRVGAAIEKRIRETQQVLVSEKMVEIMKSDWFLNRLADRLFDRIVAAQDISIEEKTSGAVNNEAFLDSIIDRIKRKQLA